jgi:2-polyprenyl-6-methoxyphenol hydroxylase-like FAD-dependent oxidoreductase
VKEVPVLIVGGGPVGLTAPILLSREGVPSLLVERHPGKRLLQAAISAAWEAGCYKVMLMTGSKDPATLAFYAAAGFEQTKTGFQVRRLPARTQS